MATATKRKAPSVEHRELTEKRDRLYAELQEIKRLYLGHDTGTQMLMATLTARGSTHPEEFQGPSRMPKPGTEAAKLGDEIRARQLSPNPHQQEFDQARADFHAADDAIEEWRERNILGRLDEANGGKGANMVRQAAELLAAGVAQCQHEHAQVRDIVVSTRRLDGQHVRHDPRLGDLAAVAADLLENPITPAGLTELGAARLTNA